MTKANKMLRKILEDMEKQHFTQGEAEWMAKRLVIEIEENKKRAEYNREFKVFRY